MLFDDGLHELHVRDKQSKPECWTISSYQKAWRMNLKLHNILTNYKYDETVKLFKNENKL